MSQPHKDFSDFTGHSDYISGYPSFIVPNFILYLFQFVANVRLSDKLSASQKMSQLDTIIDILGLRNALDTRKFIHY